MKPHRFLWSVFYEAWTTAEAFMARFCCWTKMWIVRIWGQKDETLCLVKIFLSKRVKKVQNDTWHIWGRWNSGQILAFYQSCKISLSVVVGGYNHVAVAILFSDLYFQDHDSLCPFLFALFVVRFLPFLFSVHFFPFFLPSSGNFKFDHLFSESWFIVSSQSGG